MSITNISSRVRIVTYGSQTAFEGLDDVVVERCTDGQWSKAWGTNSISNDYAYTEARERAQSINNQEAA